MYVKTWKIKKSTVLTGRLAVTLEQPDDKSSNQAIILRVSGEEVFDVFPIATVTLSIAEALSFMERLKAQLDSYHEHCMHSPLDHENMGWTCSLWPVGGPCCGLAALAAKREGGV